MRHTILTGVVTVANATIVVFVAEVNVMLLSAIVAVGSSRRRRSSSRRSYIRNGGRPNRRRSNFSNHILVAAVH